LDVNNSQPYKYGGKEEETMLGLAMFDFHARQYYGNSDNRPPVFGQIDPLAEDYYSTNPYMYCLGNPIRLIDPTGMSSEESSGDESSGGSGSSGSGPSGSGVKPNTPPGTTRTVTASERLSLPENPLVTASVSSSQTTGEAGSVNINTTETVTTELGSSEPSSMSTSVEIEGKTSVVGAEGKIETSTDGSITKGISVSVGPIQIGISETTAPSLVNSSLNINVDIKTGKNTSVGASVGVKPVGIISVGASIGASILLKRPVLIPAIK
jgi:RHS repeat-associated protein